LSSRDVLTQARDLDQFWSNARMNAPSDPAAFGLAPEDIAFRQEVRQFFADNLPAELVPRISEGIRLEPEEWRAWQRVLHARGWGAPLWPVEHGGTGWSATQIYIFEEEAARAHAPPQYHQGLNLIAPILMDYGNAAQKARYLPRILSGDDWWCQGYSEPNAGSDLASLKCRAERDGDVYVVTGQKTWTSYAHAASHMFLLARTSTSERKQDGISLLLIEMDSPGVTVRPIMTMDGRHHTNEVFLEGVRVPAENLVGEEGRGWGYGKALLARERALSMMNGLRLAQHLRSVAARVPPPRPDDPDAALRRRLNTLQIEVEALNFMILQSLASEAAGAPPGATASILKLRWSEILQAVGECGLEIPLYAEALQGQGPENLSASSYFFNRAVTIYGGTSEVQRNVVARALLS
jgi:alkylation response protein AidB-like acyl-CoA dehydrogenase